MTKEKSENSLARRRLLRTDVQDLREVPRCKSMRRPGLKGNGTGTGTGTIQVSSCCSSSSSLSICEEEETLAIGTAPPNRSKLYLPCENDKPDDNGTIDPIAQLRKKQVDFWHRCVINRTVSLGSRHVRTAEALMELGNAQLRAQDSVAAFKTYSSALKVFQAIYGDMHLSVARALDKVGLAASMTHSSLDLALATLLDGWKIRYTLLGPDHIDSVDSLNHIAGVYLNRGDFAVAARYYKLVMTLRQEIFGDLNHTSVAVTAYHLACILEDRMDKGSEAHIYFNLTKHIYECIGLIASPFYVDTCARLKKHSTLLEL